MIHDTTSKPIKRLDVNKKDNRLLEGGPAQSDDSDIWLQAFAV